MNTKSFTLTIAVIAMAGLVVLSSIFADSDSTSIEPETSANSTAKVISDPDASGGKALEFNATVTSRPFSFAAAGDFSTSEAATKVFESIASGSTDFTLALGDLGYTGNGQEQKWCDRVKDILGDEYPFQLIAGNHDDKTTGDGDIIEYRKCLPNRVGEIDGDYAIEYSFDYENVARFIMISPDIRNYGADYAKGDSNYGWVQSQVSTAREKGIRWIFLGMHKNCITPGQKSCEIGEDILNLAIESGIDVILQGHEHGYFRSKQLSFSEDCPAIVADAYNASCVADDDDDFEAEKGSVIVISGAGGISLRDASTRDEEYNYFNGVSSKNIDPSHGYAKFDVTRDKITKTFIGVNGDFQDSFQMTHTQP